MPTNPANIPKAIGPTFGIIKAKIIQNNPLDFFSTHCSKMALLTTCRACVSGCDFQKIYDQGVSEQVLFNS